MHCSSVIHLPASYLPLCRPL